MSLFLINSYTTTDDRRGHSRQMAIQDDEDEDNVDLSGYIYRHSVLDSRYFYINHSLLFLN